MPSSYPGSLDSFATNKANGTATVNDHPTHHNDLADAVNKIEAELGTDPAGLAATVKARIAALEPPAPGTFDDYFDDASLDSDWVAILPSGANTITEAADPYGKGRLSILYSGQTANDLAGIVKPITGLAIGDYVQASIKSLGYDANFQMAALIFSDGSVAGSNQIAVYVQSQSGGQNILATRGGTFDTVGADIQTAAANSFNISSRMAEFHVRFTWQAANTFRVEWSPDGISWIQRLNDSARTLTPTHLGLGWTMWGGANNSIASFGYFKTNA